MADPTKGMGVCLIPNDKDIPCSRQIEEGEPIGTVIFNRTAMVGHRACANGYHQRTQAAEREKRVQSMKIGKQEGPGGAIGDPEKYPDALAFGSKPLVPEEKIPPSGVTATSSDGQLAATAAPLQVSSTLTAHEQGLIEAWREGGITGALEYERQQESREPVTYNLTLDLTEVPTDVDILRIELDLRKLRP